MPAATLEDERNCCATSGSHFSGPSAIAATAQRRNGIYHNQAAGTIVVQNTAGQSQHGEA